MIDLGLVHVVYAPYGPPPFERFVESYRRHPAGVDHELILVCKAFQTPSFPEVYREMMSDLPHRLLFMPDGGFDLGSYLLAARTCEHRYLCFLNSSSVILADGWLAKLRAALDEPGVGLAGATGSHESHVTDLRYQLPGLLSVRGWRSLRNYFGVRRQLVHAARDFAEFPNPHLRTNALLIERQRLLALSAGPFRSKEDCYLFESGRTGLTAAVLDAGLQVCVVGRDGHAWPPEEWPLSRTFRSGNQENLLVADNRTRDYKQADASTRRMLARFAWGETSLN